MLPVPPHIDILPEHLIDQIKAGEVIERPGNLIKEILENAVDAGATKIELSLKNNGLDLISLKDNGHGMRENDLPLAFSRHATSKISRFEDLYRLRSFGFRGEALASIASIAKVQCQSFVKGEAEGSEIRIEGGLTTFQGKRKKSGFEHGTELVIQDLFFNTPVRLKFIQSQQSEKQFIKKIIFSFILSHPEIEFHLKFEDDDKEIYPTQNNLLERLEQILPKAKSLILHGERFYENYELEVYLIPGHIKAPVKWQNIFINGRYVLDKQLHRVLSNALMANLGNDDYHYIAFINLPPDSIDVNVHPNKTVIKIMESSKLLSLMTSTIKEISSHRPNVTASPSLPKTENTNLFDHEALTPVLQQTRHEYNMEGLFSPHGIGQKVPHTFWIDAFFIKNHLAVSAKKLLEHFILLKLKTPTNSIPLLVSEPFSSKGISHKTIQTLSSSGLELEFLGSDTIVLRAIPDWMNGFPLHGIVECLLHEKSFQDLEVNPQDWSDSTWDELFSFFDLEFLLRNKIALDLKQILTEKLK